MKKVFSAIGFFFTTIWEFITTMWLAIVLLLVVCSCIGLFVKICVDIGENKVITETHAFNVEMEIMTINSDCSLTPDKYQTPRLCSTILFRTIEKPYLYREINTCKMGREIHINTEWLYNHQKGDVVHFDYLRKDKFFEIKEI